MKEIHRISIADEVVENIKEMIESGKYDAGSKLPTEMALCDMLKVSRTSVREAIRVLQALGYVEIRPGKGAFVSSRYVTENRNNWFNVDDVNYFDFMEVRMAVEELSVRLAVERATDKQIRELEEIHHSFEDACAHTDPVRLLMLDELFHTKIVSFTGNKLLININKQLVAAFRPYRSYTFVDERFNKNALEPHSRILCCLQIRNAALAVKEMHTHLEISAQDITVAYNEANGKPASVQ